MLLYFCSSTNLLLTFLRATHATIDCNRLISKLGSPLLTTIFTQSKGLRFCVYLFQIFVYLTVLMYLFQKWLAFLDIKARIPSLRLPLVSLHVEIILGWVEKLWMNFEYQLYVTLKSKEIHYNQQRWTCGTLNGNKKCRRYSAVTTFGYKNYSFFISFTLDWTSNITKLI